MSWKIRPTNSTYSTTHQFQDKFSSNPIAKTHPKSLESSKQTKRASIRLPSSALTNWRPLEGLRGDSPPCGRLVASAFHRLAHAKQYDKPERVDWCFVWSCFALLTLAGIYVLCARTCAKYALALRQMCRTDVWFLGFDFYGN